MINTIKLLTTKVATKDGRAFVAYFAYPQEMRDGNYHDIVETNSMFPKGRIRSIRVHIPQQAPILSKIDGQIPCYVELQEKQTDKGKPYYFITKDKDKNGLPRKDKNGRTHKILVLNDSDNISKATLAQLTLDDILEDL